MFHAQDDETSQSSARLKEETTEGSSERHTSIKAETDSSSHSDLISVKGPSSDDVPRKVKEEEPEDDDDEPIEEDVTKVSAEQLSVLKGIGLNQWL